MILRIITGEGEALETLLQLELKKAPTAKHIKQLKEYESREVSVIKVILNDGVKLTKDIADTLSEGLTNGQVKAMIVKVK